MKRKIVISAAILFVVGSLCLAYAYFVEPRRLVVREYDLKIKNWNPALNGFRIVAISDIHGGSNGVNEERIREIVARANEQQPDIIVLLGDYVSQSGGHQNLRMPVSTIAANLRGFNAKHGTYAVMGNHDGWYNESAIRRELTSAGISVLENHVVSIEKNGAKLRIFGIEDHLNFRGVQEMTSKWQKILAPSETEGGVIVLEHSPDVLPILTSGYTVSPQLRLVLAGHTHGGQVCFPVIGCPIIPSSYGQRYAYGHIREQNLDMFVTTGIGTSILPIRFGVPPEISVLNIQAE